MKTPTDYLSLIETIVNFRNKDDKTGLFRYYLNKYILNTPKLFVYGNTDLLLRPFFNRKALEKHYESCGNAEIYHGNFSHFMNENPHEHIRFMAIKNAGVTERIVKFLNRNF
jgi:hypothetical protein